MGAARAADLPAGVVTLLFTDIEGSTRLLQELGNVYGDVLAEHHRLLRGVWAAHDGTEVDTEGDGFFVAFASVSAAVTAAADAQQALADHAWPQGRPVRVRMALHTGEPRVHDDTYWGIDVHYAARLCSAAHGGQVLLSAATRALVPDADVDDLGEHALKDFTAPRTLFHLVVGERRSSAFPPPRTLENARTNLPSIATPLLGRETELADLTRRLTETPKRLITLIGAGGSGKTRLAIACGDAVRDAFADGVFLVQLAPIPDASGVPGALVEGLAMPRAEADPEAAILDYLGGRELLLVIDNLEHVLDAAGLLGRVLAAAPGVRILATSQAPLRLAAETVVPVEPLGLPDPSEHDPEAVTGAPAVAMFVERARAVDPAFVLAPGNAAAVAELCRQLDGLPLALELAAARVRMAGVDTLLGALGRGVEALGRGTRDMPARQRGLRAALDWTVSLLEPEQRELFAGLGVFAGAWTLEQAERVFGAEIDVWEAMAALLDFSLLHTRGDGRLTMAERVRRHARELLAADGREHDLRVLHAELMAETAEVLNLEVSLDLEGTIARTRDVLDEIELAITWCRDHDRALYRRLLAAGGRPLYFVGRIATIAPEIAALVAADEREDEISGRLLIAQAMVDVLHGEMDKVLASTQAAVDCHRRTASARSLAASVATHAHMLTLAGRGPDARAAVAEGLALAANLPDQRLRDQLEGTIAFAAVVEENWEEAEERLLAILARPERRDFAANAAISYLADCALGQGQGVLALERYGASLEREIRNTDTANMAVQMVGIAAALAVLARDEDAARVFGAAERVGGEVGMNRESLMSGEVVTPPIDALRERMGSQAWERATARGRELNADQAAAMALELIPAPA
jgi:predicted ATPase/class 3 adenylate cyclase